MPLITTIDEVRQYGVNVNMINDNTSIADMTLAEVMFIKPIVGAEMYAEMLATPADFEDILPYVKRALAPLAYFLELSTIQTQITDNGLATSNSENFSSAHRWEYEAVKDSLETKGCFFLEELIEFLSTPEIAAAYEWSFPDEYDLIFKTGKDFDKCFALFQPWRTFFKLRPIIKMVEDEAIRKSIGDDFFEEMRDLVLPVKKSDRNDVQEKQFKAIDLIKRATAFYTIAKAVDLLPIKISASGFTVSLRDAADKVNPQDQNADKNQFDNLRTSAEKSADTYLFELKNYLNTNASDTLFATFKASSLYTAPSTAEKCDPNATQRIFTL